MGRGRTLGYVIERERKHLTRKGKLVTVARRFLARHTAHDPC